MLLHPIKHDVQGLHAGCAQHQLTGFDLRANQRQARLLALRDKYALSIHHHPGPVQLQSRIGQHCLAHLDPRTGFDGMHKQACDLGTDIAMGYAGWLHKFTGAGIKKEIK